VHHSRWEEEKETDHEQVVSATSGVVKVNEAVELVISVLGVLEIG
jgi:hypothetical protein